MRRRAQGGVPVVAVPQVTVTSPPKAPQPVAPEVTMTKPPEAVPDTVVGPEPEPAPDPVAAPEETPTVETPAPRRRQWTVARLTRLWRAGS